MKTYLIDLDGTMYHGKKIIPSAKRFIDWCLANGQPFLFLTNNSSRTQQQAADHMLNIGYEGIKPEMFYTSAMAAAHTAKMMNKGNRAYYIGEAGMQEALFNEGFVIDDKKPDFVFIGLQKNASYQDYSKAVQFILNGAILAGTNNDRILLTENGPHVGNGSVVAMFEYCTQKPSLKIGKPHQPILDGVLDYGQLSKDEVVILGDNLETDILCGINGKVETIFVTTGVHQREDIERLNIHPDKIIDDLMELVK